MIKDLKKLRKLYITKNEHFLCVDYSFYKRWKYIIRLIVSMNKKYTLCEIYRKKYKMHENFVVVGLKWNGSNVRRRTTGFAKNFLSENNGCKCIYCDVDLTSDNSTTDHIVPISKRGNNCKVNLVVTCLDCNNERGNMEFYDYFDLKKRIKNKFI